jgi:hypothetical protein
MKKNLLVSTLLMLIACLGFAQPVITGFTPKYGPAGSTVTITGTGFNTSLTGNLVFFGSVAANVNAVTSTSIKVTVPAGITCEPIGVLNTSTKLSAFSSAPFLLTFAGGNASIGLEPEKDIPLSYTSNSIKLADLDGDRKLDMVITNSFDTLISVFRNNSDSGQITLASFDPKTDFRTAPGPEAICIGDIDRDGKPDLVITCYNSDTKGALSVLRNTSVTGILNSASFAPKVDFLTGAYPSSACISDLNGDGKPDIAVVNSTDNKICIFKNTAVPGTIAAGSLATPVYYTITESTDKLVADDIDGDNKPDLIAGGLNLTIYRNTSTGGSSSAISFATGFNFTDITAYWSFTTGDLDGDGKSDLILSTSNALLLFRNTATKGSISKTSFQAPVTIPSLLQVHDVELSDMDGDSKPDIIISEYKGNKISVFRNNSTSGSITASAFSEKNEFPSEVGPSSLCAGDIDRDGKSDIAVALYGASYISLYRNNLAPIISRFTPTTGSAGDTISISGSNFTGVSSVKIGGTEVTQFQTINNFTIRAVVAAGSKGLIEISGTRGKAVSVQSFMPAPVILSLSPAAGPVGSTVTISGENFNSDPAKNVVFFGGTTAKVLTASSSVLTVSVPAGTTFRNITVLDTQTGLSGTGKKPFMVTFSSYIAPSSLTAMPEMTGNVPYTLNVADLDKDGKTDFLVVNTETNQLTIYKNISSDVSNLTFAGRLDLKTGDKPGNVKIGDLDGDGKPDLVVANNGGNSISIYRNTSTPGNIDSASFSEKSEIQLQKTVSTIEVADIDNDGKTDILAGISNTHIAIFRNNSTPGNLGSYSFDKEFRLYSGMGSSFLECADFDGDGRTDVLTAANGGMISIFRNLSQSGILQANSFAAGFKIVYEYMHALTTGDLDGNGKPDIIVTGGSEPNSKVSVFSNNSVKDTLKFAGKIDYKTSGRPLSVNVADINGDGKPELVISNYTSNSISVLRNTSNPGSMDITSFAQKTDYKAVNSTSIAADMNGDGKTDIVYGSQYNNKTGFLINTPQPPAINALSAATGLKGSALTITGKEFEDVQSVTIGGVAVKSFTVSSSTSISVVVQDENSGTVTVITKYGTATSAGNFALIPEVFSVTGGGTYFKGGAGVSVGLSGSEKGMKYQLKRNDTAIGLPVTGTGVFLDFGLQTKPGVYTVTATNTVIPSPQSVMNHSATVSVNDVVTSTVETGTATFKVFSETNRINIETTQSPALVQICDLNGKVIFESAFKNSFSVPIDGNCIYLVRLKTNDTAEQIVKVFVD